jgi:bisphosphoglycerate-independent phosphoglycerate mutase (AlkP superfamily)
VTSAGILLKTLDDLFAGEALSADFTGEGLRERLGLPDTPVLQPFEAGERLAALTRTVDFAFFEFWLSDYAGHSQDMAAARSLLETFDQVLAGLLASWEDREGLVLLTSDHGNLEDLSTRRHTANPVPALLVGTPALRDSFAASLQDLTDITPAILNYLENRQTTNHPE